jgi:glycosyltransferase involved in cell wall biosynthesis
MNSLYSVAAIITTYNSSKFIQRTILSALQQDYERIEITVVDDGSTDDTVRKVESFGPRIRILHHPNQGNRGPAASRNLGIKSTGADLIAFLDHDDLWHPTKTREQVTIFNNYPDVGLVHTNGYAIDENDNILYELMPKDFNEPNQPEAILLNCYIKTPSSVIVRRKLLGEVGMFDEGFRISSDHDLWVRMKEITNFYFLAKHLLGIREHGTRLSVQRERAMWEAGFDVLERAMARYPYGLGVKRKRLAVLHYRLGVWDLKNGHYQNAFKNFLLAFNLDPYRSVKVLCGQAIKPALNLVNLRVHYERW